MSAERRAEAERVLERVVADHGSVHRDDLIATIERALVAERNATIDEVAQGARDFARGIRDGSKGRKEIAAKAVERFGEEIRALRTDAGEETGAKPDPAWRVEERERAEREAERARFDAEMNAGFEDKDSP